MTILERVQQKLYSKNESVDMIVNRLAKKKNLESYPWDECIAEQTKKYGAEAAPKICGYIKEKYGK